MSFVFWSPGRATAYSLSVFIMPGAQDYDMHMKASVSDATDYRGLPS